MALDPPQTYVDILTVDGANRLLDDRKTELDGATQAAETAALSAEAAAANLNGVRALIVTGTSVTLAETVDGQLQPTTYTTPGGTTLDTVKVNVPVIGQVGVLRADALGEILDTIDQKNGRADADHQQALADAAAYVQSEADVNEAIAQALAVGGTIRYATEAALLAAAPGAAGNTAWAQDTAAWYQSDGSAWVLIGGGAISEDALTVKVARYRANRTPTQNAAYLNGLLAGGNVKVILQGRRTWLTDRALLMADNSVLDLNGSTVKFAQVPTGSSNAVVTNTLASTYQGGGVPVNANITIRDGTLDAGGFGTAGTSNRYNGFNLIGVGGFLVENVTCQNGSGYLQWLPGSSYGTLRNTTSLNGEENLEISSGGHHITVDGYRSKDSAVNGILLYQGANNIIFSNCRVEGNGNGLNIAYSYGDVHDVTVDDTCDFDVQGVPLLASGELASTYAGLPDGATRDPVSGHIRTAKGQTLYVPDQRLFIRGRFRSRTANAVQTGSDARPVKGLILGGRFHGLLAVMMFLGATAEPIRLRDAHLVMDSVPGSAQFPAMFANEMALDFDGGSVEIRNEPDPVRRRYLIAASGTKLRRVRARGLSGYFEVHSNALIKDCEVDALSGYYDGNRVEGGAFRAVSLPGASNVVMGVYASEALSVTGAQSSIIGCQVAAGGTFSDTHATALELGNYVGATRRAHKGILGAASGPVFARAVHYDSQAITGAWARLTGSAYDGAGWTDADDQFNVTASGLYRITVGLYGQLNGAGTVYLRAMDGAGNAFPMPSYTATASGPFGHVAITTISVGAPSALYVELYATVAGAVYAGTTNTFLLFEKIS